MRINLLPKPKIVKVLKKGSFIYDEETQEFVLVSKITIDGVEKIKTIRLNKIYAFAFSRFLTRISQRNWNRKQISINSRKGGE